jgi:hypothetical protein
MEQPTEPGFYWARLHGWSSDTGWQPVRVAEGGDVSTMDVGVLSSGREAQVLEWGPRIEPPGTPRRGAWTGRSLPLETGEVLAEVRWDDGSVAWCDARTWPRPITVLYTDPDAPR